MSADRVSRLVTVADGTLLAIADDFEGTDIGLLASAGSAGAAHRTPMPPS
jgi:hypothetical protein